MELLEGNSLDMTRMQSESSICGHVGSIARGANNQISSGGAVCQSGTHAGPRTLFTGLTHRNLKGRGSHLQAQNLKRYEYNGV